MMKNIQITQISLNSRYSTIENPLLFVEYLPIHTGNNAIVALQKTLKQFLENHGLWKEYDIEYSNSIDDSGDVKEEYNDFIDSMRTRTINGKKRGFILSLGSKGGIGITYKYYDVTVSLDDSHNLDNQKQKFSRALIRGNKLQYYTISNSGSNNTKLPIKKSGKYCTNENGDIYMLTNDKLYTGDKIYVDGYKLMA